MALFSKRDIAANEELCFSYLGFDPDDPDESNESKAKKGAMGIKNKCECGARGCAGFMFG